MPDKPELSHVAIARKYIGLSEIGATNKHPTIDAWAKTLSGKWLIGQPWCGTFCAQVFKEAGLSAKIPKDFFRAKEWKKDRQLKLFYANNKTLSIVKLTGFYYNFNYKVVVRDLLFL